MLSAVRRSLRAKIVIVVLLTTFVALAVSTATLLVYEAHNYSAFLLNDAATQADLLADITAPALAFDDPAAAEANLQLLSRRQEVSAAAVYSASGELFAPPGSNGTWASDTGAPITSYFLGFPGDYNNNGSVDADDYVVWRENEGTPAEYDAWRAHFGEPAGSGSGARASSAVPEPATLVMLIAAAAGMPARRRWWI